MPCKSDDTMLLGWTVPCSSDQPGRLYGRVPSHKTCHGKNAPGRLCSGRNDEEEEEEEERDLRARGRQASCRQGLRLGEACTSLASTTSPRRFFVAALTTGPHGHGQATAGLRSITIGFLDTPIGPNLPAVSCGNISLGLPLHQKAGLVTNTLQSSLVAVGAAGSHFVHERLTKLASWATLAWPTVGIPRRSAGSVHSEATTEPSRLTERKAAPHRAHKKSKRRHSGNNSHSDDNDDGHRAKSKSKRRREAEGTRLNLACPFAKKDPVRWRSCYRHELSKISYVKQHLYRVHLQPLYCHRCGATYDRQEDLSEHMRSTTPCDVRSFSVPEGLTVEQRQRLSERLSSKLSDEERWYAVFEIVFPGHPHPATPYVDPDMSEDLSSFRDYIAREGPGILAKEYRDAEDSPPAAAAADDDEAYSSFEAIMRRGLEQISSSWFSFRSSYVNQLDSPRRRRSPTAASQADVDKAAEAPEDD